MDYPKTQPNINLYNGKFTEGDPEQGIAASRDAASWANAVTDEILNVLSAAGLTPNEADASQLLQALNAKWRYQVKEDATLASVTEKTFTGLEAGKRYVLDFELDETITDAQNFDLQLRFGNAGGIDDGGNYSNTIMMYYGGYANYGEPFYSAGADSLGLFGGNGDFIGSGTSPLFGKVEFSLDPADAKKAIANGECQYAGRCLRKSILLYSGAENVDRVQLLTTISSATFSGRATLFQK